MYWTEKGFKVEKRRKRLVVIGLDSAEPSLVFSEQFSSIVPGMRELMKRGTYGKMESILPPITVPAWMCLATGKSPGELGIYGFRNRRDYSYERLEFPLFTQISAEPLWETLSRYGKKSFIQGVPLTYPPRPLKGLLISCLLTPENATSFTYPAHLQYEIHKKFGTYLFDVKGFRTENREELIQKIEQMTRQHFAVLKHYLQQEDWDFVFFVEIGLDRVHHAFWRFFDPEHPLHTFPNAYYQVIPDYYRLLDEFIGEIVGNLDSDTGVVIVSDHGAQRMEGALCINEWLQQKGYLTIKDRPVSGGTSLTSDMVNWEKTLAWAEGGYYARIFLNIRGREPMGIVPPEKAQEIRDELSAQLEHMVKPDGTPMGNKVYRPEEIYPEVRGIPPDLILLPGNLTWRAAGTVGWNTLWLAQNDTGPDDANHSLYGIYIESIPWKSGEGNIGNISILNLRKRWLEHLGVEE
ncbi:MAG: alkaline phosphatase family protein [bacterium JZ-2024 1]